MTFHERMFSPEMITVYMGIITFLTLVINRYFDYRNNVQRREEEDRRRKWEIEDRQHKEQVAREAELVRLQVEESRKERKEQVHGVLRAVNMSTKASKEAIVKANNLTEKFVQTIETAQATAPSPEVIKEIAKEVVEQATTKLENSPEAAAAVEHVSHEISHNVAKELKGEEQ